MIEETKMSEVVSEIKNANEDELKKVIEQWFESTRTKGMKIGAQYISVAVFGAIEKHLKKVSKPSLRDYQRCVNEITQIIAVQLANQGGLLEEDENDGAAE